MSSSDVVLHRTPSIASCRYRSALAVAVAATLSATAHAAPPGGGYDLLFADEFNGSALDTMKWVDAYPWGRTHNHDAYVAPENVIVDNGALTLRAERRAQGGKPFTSGAISTGYTKFRFDSGYAESRLLLPSTPGSWPAFWGLNDGWPPEADIMEYPLGTNATTGYPNTDYHTAFHYRNASGGNSAGAGRVNPGGAGDLSLSYHTFGMDWVKNDRVDFYFDGNLVSSFGDDAAVAQMTSMYLILNYAVGGWPGSPSLSQWAADHADETTVDWVRVWQRRPTGASATSTWNINGNGNWDAPGNWSGIVPKLGGQQVTFGQVGAALTSTVTWDDSRTVGGLTLNGTTTRYTIGDANAGLQLADPDGTATITLPATAGADQAIAARLELYNNTLVTNASTRTLSLNGRVVADGDLSIEAQGPVALNGQLAGAGDVTVNGPGTVFFSNNNLYTGNTYVDNPVAGAAVARVTRSRPFGTVGTVVIGQNGNGTTARVEIESPAGAPREVPNAIALHGRNGASPGIVNITGDGEFSGTISAQNGGGFYVIQSDAGQLNLTGEATGANGVALTSVATGSRTFTLAGTGNGVVGGIVQNGSATVGITKAGLGTWSLNANNTYAGATVVNEGRLAVNGVHVGGNAYVAGVNGTLGGNGTIDPVNGAAVTITGRLAPGNSIGRLTVGSAGSANDVVIAGGGELEIELGAAGTSDRLVVNGRLDLSSAGDELRLIALSGAFDGSTYTIATFAPGTLGGQAFDSVFLNGVLQPSPLLGLGNGYRLVYDDAAGALALSAVTAVPEPRMLSLALLGSCAMVRRRRTI